MTISYTQHPQTGQYSRVAVLQQCSCERVMVWVLFRKNKAYNKLLTSKLKSVIAMILNLFRNVKFIFIILINIWLFFFFIIIFYVTVCPYLFFIYLYFYYTCCISVHMSHTNVCENGSKKYSNKYREKTAGRSFAYPVDRMKA